MALRVGHGVNVLTSDGEFVFRSTIRDIVTTDVKEFLIEGIWYPENQIICEICGSTDGGGFNVGRKCSQCGARMGV